MAKTKYTKRRLEIAVASSLSFAEVMRKLGVKQSGGMHSLIRSKVMNFKIDFSHFLGKKLFWGKSGSFCKKSWQEILVLSTSRSSIAVVRRALIESGRDYKCEGCANVGIWKTTKLVLQVDHKNGNRYDNRLDNVRFLCPNCHSQTDNWGIKNAVLDCQKYWCLDCGENISRQGTRCKRCAAKYCRKTKIIWPTYDELQQMVNESSFLATARKLGVTDNAIRKRLKNHC